jgi:prepilin-type processing-associated H-X9-DG protein/prepilin-type N-terminal cleavage/methylation domain-containing protein
MSNRAFTIIEVLVCVAITGSLIGLLIPAIQSARQSARNTACQNKMRQLAIALHAHSDTFGKLPAGTELSSDSRYLSFGVRILPFLEQNNIYEVAQASLRRSSDVFSPTDHPLLQMANPSFTCPQDSRVNETALAVNTGKLVGLLSYLGSNGTNHIQQNGVLFGGSKISLRHITDGTSNTLLLGERPPSAGNDYGWWYAGVGNGDGTLDHTLGSKETIFSRFLTATCEPNHFRLGSLTNECSTSHFWSLHPGGANFAFCDGSIRFLSYGSSEVIPLLSSRNGHEVISGETF